MKTVIAIIVVGLVALGLWTRYRLDTLHRAFVTVQEPASESSLRRDLGSPWRTGSCGQAFGGDMPPGCTKEVIYASPFAPMLPDYWAYRFDKNGALLNRYEYVSP